MPHLSLLAPVTKEAVKAFAEKRNLTEHFSENYQHPQEDYLLASDTPPVFVVADGVTLNFKKLIEDKKEYPNPSPAGKVAQIFCEAVQENAVHSYQSFQKASIADIFKKGNSAVAEYNKKLGQSDFCGNKTGYYSATGSFMVIKDNKAYWASICDAFFAHFDKDMNLKFMSSGLCSPYAVINGEEKMAEFIEQGEADLHEGDRLFVFTDGFEHYVKNADFLALFKNWSDDMQERITEFSQRMNQKDPEKYGHERSLIAVVV